jgi:cytochrome b561
MNTRSLRFPRLQALSTADSASSRSRHGWLTIFMHWSSALAVLLAAGSVLWREWVELDSLRAVLMQVHKQAGLFVLVALGVRLAARWAFGFKNYAGPMHPLLSLAAHAAHISLYLLLFALPMLGLAVCAASALDVTFFGLFRLPPLVQDDPDLAAILSEYHIWAAWVLLAVLLAHIGAAVWHHRVRRDGILVAMAPVIRRADSRQASPGTPLRPVSRG